MDLMPTVVNALVIALVGVLVTFVTRGQIRDLKVDLDDVRQDMRELRREMNDRFTRVESEIAALRSDLTHVALAVGARTRP